MQKKPLYFVLSIGFILVSLGYFFIWDIKTIEKILSRHQYLSCKGTYWSNLGKNFDEQLEEKNYVTAVIIEYPRLPYINYMVRTEFGLAFGLYDIKNISDDISPYFFYNDDNKIQFQYGYIDVFLNKITKNIKVKTYNRSDYKGANGYDYTNSDSIFEGVCEEVKPLK